MSVRGKGIRRTATGGIAWVVGFGLLLVLLPAAAQASTLKINSQRAEYDAVAGETNQLTVTRSGDNYVFTEAGAVVITAMAPCANLGASVGICPAAGISDIDVELFDMNDTASYDQTVGPPIEEVGLDGGDGNDILTAQGPTEAYLLGRNGNDVLTGADGDDDLRGSDGNDTIAGGPGNDFVPDGDGDDVVMGGPGRDRFTSGSSLNGADLLDGGPGLSDSMDARSRTGAQTFNLNGQADDGEAGEGDNLIGFEQVDSGDGDDTMVGGSEPNDFRGNAGDDVISGGGGPDEIDGDQGDDTIDGGDGDDQIRGGSGADQEQGGAGQDLFYSAFLDDGSDSYSGGAGSDSIMSADFIGTALKVSLDGVADDGPIDPIPGVPPDNAGADVENLIQQPGGLLSGAQVSGGGIGIGVGGDDILIGNASPNRIEGGLGDDRIEGLGGPDSLIGGLGNDELDGGNGVDEIEGDGGSDAIRSRDNRPDEVGCGSASDTLLADSLDVFTVTCDQSSTGALLKTKKSKLNRKGKTRVKIFCPAAEGIACKVRFKLKQGKKTVAKGNGRVQSGKSKKLKLKLTRKGKRLKGKKLKGKATTKMTDAAGAKVTTTRKLVLKR